MTGTDGEGTPGNARRRGTFVDSSHVRRRAVLGTVATGLTGVVGGCQSLLGPTVTGSWPQYGHDAGRTNATESQGVTEPSDRWHYETAGVEATPPAVVDGTVYAGTDAGNVVALGAADGERRWQTSLGSAIPGAPAVAEGTVVVGTENGVLAGLDGNSGEERWRAELNGSVYPPAVREGVVYAAAASGDVATLSVADGAIEWTRSLERAIARAPAVGADVVAITTADSVLGLSTADGTDDWVHNHDCGRDRGGPAVMSEPMVDDRGVTLVCRLGVTSLAPDTGGVQWQDRYSSGLGGRRAVGRTVTREGDVLVSAAIEHHPRLVTYDRKTGKDETARSDWYGAFSRGSNRLFGTNGKTVYGSPRGEETTWELTAPDQLDRPPAIVDEAVFVAGQSGIYGFVGA